MSKPTKDPRNGLDPEVRRVLDDSLGADGKADEALLARVRARVLDAVRGEAPPGSTVRAGEGEWRAVFPRIREKLLWASGAERAFLLRCEPGAELPPHRHVVAEEVLVLEGSIRFEPDLVLCAGDYLRAEAGTRHGTVTTQEGALVYVRGLLEF